MTVAEVIAELLKLPQHMRAHTETDVRYCEIMSVAVVKQVSDAKGDKTDIVVIG